MEQYGIFRGYFFHPWAWTGTCASSSRSRTIGFCARHDAAAFDPEGETLPRQPIYQAARGRLNRPYGRMSPFGGHALGRQASTWL
ncbi:hypothetical protein D3C84_1120110 [compost metagenome]